MCVTRRVCFVLFAASMWRMARRRDAARWTRRPAPRQDSCCTPRSRATASAGSPSSTGPTATTTCRQRPCPGTLLSQVNSKHQLMSNFTVTKNFTCPALSSVKRCLWVVPTFHSLTAQNSHFCGLPRYDLPLPVPSLKYSLLLHNLAEELSNLYPEITEIFLHFAFLATGS